MRRLRNLAGPRWYIQGGTDTAAHRGMLLSAATFHLLGTVKHLHKIKTLTRSAGARCIIFGSMPISRQEAANAAVGFFKTGSPMMVAIQAPAGGASPTPTPTPTPSPTPTATATPSATPTATPRPTPTPRSHPTARPRPTPAPRP